MATSSFVRLAILALLWGSSFLWIAIALRALSPIQIVLVRLALGALVLYPITRARGLRLPTRPATWLHLTVAALFANVIPYTLFAVAEQHVSSSVAGVLNATTPLWTILVGFLAGTDRQISGFKLSGFIVGFLGTVVIFSPWQSGSEIASWGGLAALIAAAGYGISYVYMTRYLTGRGTQPLVLSVSQLIAATGTTLLIAPFAGGIHTPNLRWDAVTAVVILGAIILDEPLTAPVVGGMLIVLVGVAMTRKAAPG